MGDETVKRKEQKVLHGGGSLVVKAKPGSVAQGYIDRHEQVPSGYYIIDKPLEIDVAWMEPGERYTWAHPEAVFVGLESMPYLVCGSDSSIP